MTVGYSALDRILVLIPVRNEAATIGKVIESLQAWGLAHIRVVDNGSTDDSMAIALAAGADVVCEPVPGYGRACWRGLQDLPSEVEWILFCDGDGSDDLSQLADFLEARHEFDLILGDRRALPGARAALTPVQNFGNGLATFLIGLGWGYGYQDLGPLRLIRRTALEQIQMQDRGFGWTVEMQVRAVELDLRICELPVDYHPRQGGRSKISGTLLGSIKAGTIILSTLAHLYWHRLIRKDDSQISDAQMGSSPLGSSPLGSSPLGSSPLGSSPLGSSRTIPTVVWLSTCFLIFGCILMAPQGDFRQGVTPQFWAGASSMGLGFLLSWQIRSMTPVWFWLVTILTRLLLLPMYPGDDIWRYLWEGLIQTHGFSPYNFAPNAPELAAFRPSGWSHINHPNVSAIYPPLTQLGFKLLANIAPSIVLFKLAFVTADILTCWLLSRRFGYAATLVYAWNPLILYSFAGGAHYDSWFILPLVAAWLLFDPEQLSDRTLSSSTMLNSSMNRNVKPEVLCSNLYPKPAIPYLGTSICLGISIAIKWMTLPILGFLTWKTLCRIGWKRAVLVAICSGLPFLLSALPFCQVDFCPLIPADSVFVSRGRSAELIPYLIGLLWQPSKQANWYYLFPLVAVLLGLLYTTQTFLRFSESYFITLLLLSPIIHAWYFTWLVPFAVASRNFGTKLVSLSAFIYFVLPDRLAMGNPDWLLQPVERFVLWAPLLIGFLWTIVFSQRSPRPSSAKPQIIRTK